jgi:hydroxymethylpyrimidine/phosphomethylpyrimidine kinase
VEAVADVVRAHRVGALVVDPVLVATSGDSLAGADVADAIVERLFPLATVVTPNIAEASVMLGVSSQ